MEIIRKTHPFYSPAGAQNGHFWPVSRNFPPEKSAVDSLNFCRFQTPNSANVSTRVDPFGNNLFLGSLKEEDADGVTRTRCRCNLRGRMRRSHDGFQNWVSHWLKVARIPHRGGAKGRPNTCKGMFSQECAQLVVPLTTHNYRAGSASRPLK